VKRCLEVAGMLQVQRPLATERRCNVLNLVHAPALSALSPDA